MTVPKAFTPSSIMSTEQSRKIPNKGVTQDRNMHRILSSLTTDNGNNNDVDSRDSISWALQCQQMAENIHSKYDISTSLSLASGIMQELKSAKLANKTV